MSRINLHNYEAFLLDYFEGNLSEDAIRELKVFVAQHPELEIELDNKELPYFTEETIASDFKNDLKKTELDHPDEAILNYLENNLSLEEKSAFEEKLEADKDLAKDLDLYRKTILTGDANPTFSNKASLFKTEDDLILNNKSIAYLENQLSLTERVNFEKELAINVSLQKELDLVAKTRFSVDAEIVYPNKQELKKENKVIALFGFRTVASIAAAILLLFGLFNVFNYFIPKSAPVIEVAASKEFQDKAQPNAVQKKEIKHLEVSVSAKKQLALQTEKRNRTTTNHQKDTASNYVRLPSQTVYVVSTQVKEDKVIEKTMPNDDKTELVAKELGVIAEPVSQNPVTSSISEQKNVATITEEYDDDEEIQTPAKRGFWRRVADLAKQANKLGVKTMDVEESSKNAFVLSFNQFSVEKK